MFNIGTTYLLISVLISSAVSYAEVSRIKDVASFRGVRGNQLIGYGLAVGLDGTGDSRQTFFTTQTLTNLLKREGITVPARSIQVTNTAAVIVTATLPPFARLGSKIDVTVSSIGDSDSLQGGVLLMTPLRALNGKHYAVAQGPVSIGGFAVRTSSSSVQKNQPTVGRVPGGALVEREVGFSLQGKDSLDLVLAEADFMTASRVAAVINQKKDSMLALPLGSRTIQISVPQEYRSNIVEFISSTENETLEIDRPAKVVLNEKTGTIIFGSEVRISPVTIIHGSLSVLVGTEFLISQPPAFSEGETVVVPNQGIDVIESPGHQIAIEEGASIEDIVKALNAVGATPRDILAIMQAIKAAGALQAHLEII